MAENSFSPWSPTGEWSKVRAVRTAERHHDDDPAFVDHALGMLRRGGLRVTRQRKALIELLHETCAPMMPYEMKERMDARGTPIDTVSVYRILTCFEERGIVHRLPASGGYVKCHLRPGADACHHYLVCRVCRRVEEVQCAGFEPWERDVAQRTGFRVEAHHIELIGICSGCL